MNYNFTLRLTLSFLIFSFFYSNINSQVWQYKGLAGKQIYALAICTNDAILAGDNGTGLYRSTNDGNTWTLVTTGSLGKVPAIKTNSAGVIYAAYTISNGHLR